MLNVLIIAIVAITAVWVYLDATKNKIGKIPDGKGMFNMSAGAWGTVTLLLWIVGFPAYLIKRGELIEKAKEKPVEITGRIGKAVTIGIIGALWVILTFSDTPLGGVPSCSDPSATDLVLQITDREMKKAMGEKLVKELNFEVKSIRTSSTYEQTGANDCAADLQVTGEKGSKSVPITYTVEQTGDGGIYVNVFGL